MKTQKEGQTNGIVHDDSTIEYNTGTTANYVWDLVCQLSPDAKMDILSRLQDSLFRNKTELSQTEQTISRLSQQLHPETVQMLDNCDWMKDRPFPASVSAEDESWIDQAEAIGNSDIVPESIIQQDLKAWRSVR